MLSLPFLAASPCSSPSLHYVTVANPASTLYAFIILYIKKGHYIINTGGNKTKASAS